MEAAMTTSDYLRRRAILENRDAAWIAELRPEPRGLSIAQDLTAVAIPPSIMSSREHHVFERMRSCVGDSPLRSWFRIDAVYVRTVVEEVQQLLTVDIIEWKQLAAGVPFKVVEALSAEPVFKQEESKDNGAQATKGDLLMEDYELELLGQAFVSQCRIAGILELRSPRGPPENEPDPKRPQHRPARPLSISTPSGHSLIPSSDASLNAQAMSVQGSTLNASSSGVSDSVPSVIGPSGASNFSAPTQTSRDSSSSSSLLSLGHSASVHMGTVPGHLVMSVQAGGTLVATPDSGMSVTRTFIPVSRRALSDQEDVDMAESRALRLGSVGRRPSVGCPSREARSVVFVRVVRGCASGLERHAPASRAVSRVPSSPEPSSAGQTTGDAARPLECEPRSPRDEGADGLCPRAESSSRAHSGGGTLKIFEAKQRIREAESRPACKPHSGPV
ncbi:hypothetical protein ON010_g18133 [Phytophthora cinnamomi]|nr:hypothetical protein ON010_g18133 [Phytophthora cinnamomi]